MCCANKKVNIKDEGNKRERGRKIKLHLLQVIMDCVHSNLAMPQHPHEDLPYAEEEEAEKEEK